VQVVPMPGALAIRVVPPSMSQKRFTVNKPNPVPRGARARAVGALKCGSNTRGRSSGGDADAGVLHSHA
jgi:hypothetical protein